MRCPNNQTLSKQPSVPNAAYGPTKAAVHWLTKRIDAEEDSIAALVIDPGFVKILLLHFTITPMLTIIKMGSDGNGQLRCPALWHDTSTTLY
jgi:NAD(P)-dependent dehydrogenase (short-subunit alcohol dehydrogenase family)